MQTVVVSKTSCGLPSISGSDLIYKLFYANWSGVKNLLWIIGQDIGPINGLGILNQSIIYETVPCQRPINE